MKRKLNKDDIPEAINVPSEAQSETEVTFASYDLHPLLARGIRDQKWSKPTPVQASTIKPALEGKDILARAGTGTGKVSLGQNVVLLLQSDLDLFFTHKDL